MAETFWSSLQDLAAVHQLSRLLERHLGPPGPGEDYHPVARMLVAKYRAAASWLADHDTPVPLTVAAVDLTARPVVLLRRLFLTLLEEGEPPASLAALEAAADPVPEMLPPEACRDAFAALYGCVALDVAAAIQQGAALLQSDATEAAAAVPTPAVEDTRLQMRLTGEDKFLLRQLSRVGAADLLADKVDDYDDDLVEVELNDAEPAFLTGKLRNARNDRSDRTQYWQPGHGPVQTASAAPGAGGPAAGGQKDRPAFASQAAHSGDVLGVRNSMLRSALRQQEYARERRELRARQRRAAAADLAARGVTSSETTTRDVAGIAGTELDEQKEERGVRSAADFAGAAPPAWMAAKGGRVAFGRPAPSQSLKAQRAALPIYQWRQQIVDAVRANQVTVLVGETGSGKTTQIVQYLCEEGFADKGRIIGCTQPRRVAAVSLAERVAQEYGCRVGEEVGYTVRFVDETSPVTKIKYLTDGMLLREALLDDSFSKYSVLVLDEAHERSLNTDVILGIVKASLRQRPDLKVVVTSATLEIAKFCGYFGCDGALEIPGRTHPVEICHATAEVEDYVEEAMRVVMDIHLESGPGDVLVFFTGQDEIETAADRLHHWMASDELRDAPPMELCVMYGALPQENQSTIFEKTPEGSRKVVLATNIAETSITIDNLYYVVDCGFCKQNVFNPRTNVEALQIVPISQQQAKQRAGRAGRTGPGRCYRLYTEQQFERELGPATVPEIQRTNLCNVVLLLKATGVGDLLQFDFVDPPPEETLVNALERLHYLGALDGDGLLTKLGSRMSELPLDPAQSKTLLTAVDLGCAPTVLTVVSMLSTQNVFYRPRDRQEEADARKARFHAPEGDAVTLLQVYDAWVAAGETTDWCRENFVQHRALKDARDVRAQLERILMRRRAVSTDVIAVRDFVAVRKAITAGYFFQAAKRLPSDEYRTLSDRREVAIHPSSSLADSKPRYVVYHELVLTSKEYMRSAMAIDPRWLVELAPAYFSTPAPGRLTKEQMQERIDPRLRRFETGNDWRISKLRRSRK